MKVVDEFASELGMSHLQVAGLLGMGRSHFYMAMKGQRAWPAEALERLALWQARWRQQAPVAANTLSNAELKACRQLLANLEYKAELARRGYQQVQRRRAELLAQQELLSNFLRNEAPIPARERKYAELQLSQCRQRLKRYTTVHVLKAGLKLAGATEQLSSLRRQLKPYEVPT